MLRNFSEKETLSLSYPWRNVGGTMSSIRARTWAYGLFLLPYALGKEQDAKSKKGSVRQGN